MLPIDHESAKWDNSVAKKIHDAYTELHAKIDKRMVYGFSPSWFIEMAGYYLLALLLLTALFVVRLFDTTGYFD